MRGYYFSSRAPRRGQALLLAVLIMIFAALLSASFIAVVSSNLNQTARQVDKNRAFASAIAGLNYINRQLAYSDAGEQWFEANYSAATLASYNRNSLYYTSLDRAQGWAGKFAKFPDPNAPQGEGPLFLAKVERLPYFINTQSPDPDPDKRDPNKAGMLRITIIGLSANDPTAYHTIIRYKGGFQQAPLAQTMRVVSNWDFKNGVVPVGQVKGAYDATTNKVTLTNVKGEFPAVPFTVMIGDPQRYQADNTYVARSAVVTAVAAITGVTDKELTLADDPTPAPLADERIEVAASLGAPRAIDFDNSGTTIDTVGAAGSETITVKIADDISAGVPSAGGIRANGGLALSGYVGADALRSVTSNSATQPPASIRASGLISKNTTDTAIGRLTLTGQAISTSTNLLNSNQVTDFPFSAALTSQAVASGVTKDQLVSDGWNRLKGTAGGVGTRNVSTFQPPALDSSQNLERYRNLTRFSKPANPNDPATVSLYGEGQGIYIDNVQDKEKVNVTGTNALREMTQTEFVNMLLSPPVPASAAPPNYSRIGVPLALTTVGASLEQKRLRGWVGPDEFRGRGVEIVLGDNSITITRDARDDALANQFGDSVAKTWKNPTTGANQRGIYSRIFTSWPQNGVIFAEGNVRIRGNATNAPRSLTVVSMGNIYIEDSLSADDANNDTVASNGVRTTVGQPRKILLLARKNVVMNPTRVLGRPDAQTTSRDVAQSFFVVGQDNTLAVADAASFQVGDLVQASTVNSAGVETISVQGLVTGRTATPSTTDNDQILVKPLTSGVPFANSIVRTPNTIPKVPQANVPYSGIVARTDVAQRRFTTPTALTATNPLRLAFNHGANRSPGDALAPVPMFAVTTVGPGKPATPIYLTHKRVVDANNALVPGANTVSDLNKLIRGDYTDPAGSPDTFPDPKPTAETATPGQTGVVAAREQILSLMETQMEAKPHVTNIGGTGNGWNYSVGVAASHAAVPFFYLAGVGNRYNYGYAPIPPFTDWNGAATLNNVNMIGSYNVPLATSIGLWLNTVGRSTANPITSESWNGAAYDQTTQFGFNPNYQDVSASPATLPEDILTTDQSFYHNVTQRTTLDSRSLGVTNAGSNSLVLRQSEGLIGINDTTTLLPEYRIRGLKMEDVTLAANSSTVDSIRPAYTFDVNAFVYAQTGSWFVIPGGLFDGRLRGDATRTYLNLDGNASPTKSTGEFLDVNNDNVWDVGEYADLNRNGTIEDAERYAMARYSRYNYSINFTGAIAENQTALVNSVASSTLPVGGVNSWMNSWVTVNKRATDDTATPNINEALPYYDRMKYTFDPTIALGGLQQDDPTTPAYDADTGFRLPQTPSLFSIS